MNIHFIKDTDLQEVISAIREKNRMAEDETFNGSDMPDLIRNVGAPYVDTSKLTNFSFFCTLNRLEEIDFENIDFSNGENFRGMFSDSDRLTECPYFDTSKATNTSLMFKNCESLKTVPHFDTSQVTNFREMFYNVHDLEYIPPLNTSNGTDFYQTFYRLVCLTEFPSIDTSKGTNFYQCWYGDAVTTFPEFNLTSATNLKEAFRQCSKAVTFTNLIFDSAPTNVMTNMFQSVSQLENITITGTIKVNSNNLSFANSPKLTVESMLSVLNALEDNTGEGTRYTVYFGSTNLAKLTDEQKAIAENKNISLG